MVWIESKASFGTKENNESNMEQFWGYRNRYVQFVAVANLQRYGPGLVIYWQVIVENDLNKQVWVSAGYPRRNAKRCPC